MSFNIKAISQTECIDLRKADVTRATWLHQSKLQQTCCATVARS